MRCFNSVISMGSMNMDEPFSPRTFSLQAPRSGPCAHSPIPARRPIPDFPTAHSPNVTHRLSGRRGRRITRTERNMHSTRYLALVPRNQLQLLPTSSSCPHLCTTRTSPWPEKQEVFSAEIISLGQEEPIYFQPLISTQWRK